MSHYRLPLLGLLLLLVSALAGCAFRPSSAVLQPSAIQAPADVVTVLAVTNRVVTDDGGYGPLRAARLSYERYAISVPPNRKPAEIRYAGERGDPARDYLVLSREQLTQAQFLRAAEANLAPDGTAGLFVHGYNHSYQEALFRLAQVQADAGMHSTAIMFSWPSEATLTGYMADRDASLASRNDLAATIELLASRPRIERVVVAAHSMGGFLTMETLRQLDFRGRSAILDKLGVILAAPDIDADVFASQLETIGRLDPPITLMVSQNDRALALSSLLGSERPRVGMLDVNDPAAQAAVERFGVTVIDITSVEAQDAFGHDGFASVARFARHFAVSDARRNATFAEAGLFIFDATQAELTPGPSKLEP